MGNAQSAPRHNLYITKVSNMDLPICPFIHAIVGYNSMSVKDIDPLMFRQILLSQDLSLEILDVRDGSKFKVKIPRGTEKLGINVIKLSLVPELMKMQVTAVKESSSTPLRGGDQILGVEGRYCDTEDEVVYHIKAGGDVRLVVLRDGAAEHIELTSTELGCEIGIGILYKAKDLDYYMKDYNGRIQREHSSKSGENSDTVCRENQKSGGDVEAPVDSGSLPTTQETNGHAINGLSDKIDSIQISDNNLEQSLGLLNRLCASDSEPGHSLELDEKVHKVLPVPPEPRGESSRNTGTDRTASYVYKPPRNSARKDQTLDQKNYDQIFSEANLPRETEYFGGERFCDKEAVNILNQTLVSRDDFVEGDGGEKMKDDVYSQRMESAGGMQALFDEDDEDLPFGSGMSQSSCSHERQPHEEDSNGEHRCQNL